MCVEKSGSLCKERVTSASVIFVITDFSKKYDEFCIALFMEIVLKVLSGVLANDIMFVIILGAYMNIKGNNIRTMLRYAL